LEQEGINEFVTTDLFSSENPEMLSNISTAYIINHVGANGVSNVKLKTNLKRL
jgi:hypothetical protein